MIANRRRPFEGEVGDDVEDLFRGVERNVCTVPVEWPHQHTVCSLPCILSMEGSTRAGTGIQYSKCVRTGTVNRRSKQCTRYGYGTGTRLKFMLVCACAWVVVQVRSSDCVPVPVRTRRRHQYRYRKCVPFSSHIFL